MQIPSQWQAAGLSLVSLIKGSSTPPEMYIPLWWHSGNTFATNYTSASANNLVAKGSVNVATSSSSSTKLHTLNANWNPNNKYAFEATIWTPQSGQTAYAQLWDITAGAAVSGTQISTTATTATVVRSGQVTLTPGHIYGITLWSSSSSYNALLTDASLIVFPS